MKRILSIFLLTCLLAGCANEATPIARRGFPDSGENAIVKMFWEVYDNTVGNLSFVKKRTIKKTMLPLYRHVLDGDAPYLVENVNGKIFDRTLSEAAEFGNISFTFYQHKDFHYPLLVLCNDVNGIYLFSIVQFFSDGTYATFSSLMPSERTIFSNHIYVDSEGNLYLDDAHGETIYALHVIDGILKIDYAYTPEFKGPATVHEIDPYSDYMAPHFDYIGGSDQFYNIRIVEETKEPCSQEEFDALNNRLAPVDIYPNNETNFNYFANQYTDGEWNESEPSASESKNPGEEELRTFAQENLNIYTKDEGEECLYIADYDDNGALCAYAIVKDHTEKLKLVFIDENFDIHDVTELQSSIFDGDGYGPMLIEAGEDEYLLITFFGTAAENARLFGVKDNQVYKPNTPEKLGLFKKHGDTFVNNISYNEFSATGGVRKEKESTWTYDQKSRSFVDAKDKNAKDDMSLVIDGKDAGKINVIKKNGKCLVDVGEFNKQCILHVDDSDFSNEELDSFFKNIDVLARANFDNPHQWLFFTWPGFSTYFYMYDIDDNKIYDISEESEDLKSGESTTPYVKPIIENDMLYMDLDSLCEFVFNFSYTIDGNKLKIKSVQ